MTRAKRAIAAFLLLGGIAANMVWSQEAQAFRASWGVLVVPVLDPAAASKVANPALMFNLGASLRVAYSEAPIFSFDPAADFYWCYYELSPDGRPWPTTVEERTAFVIGLVLDLPIFVRISLSDTFSLEFGAGPCFDLRYGISAAKDAPASDVAAINAYFWKEMRYLMPSTTLRAEYRLTDRVAFGFSARALWPISNLWAGKDLPFLDRALLGAGIIVRYGLR